MVDAPRDDDGPGTRPARPALSPKEHPSDIAAIEDDSDEPVSPAAELDARRAYEVLEIRTPLEEFEAYARARVDTLVRLGDPAKAELTSEALELGRRALARVTGAALPERGAR